MKFHQKIVLGLVVLTATSVVFYVNKGRSGKKQMLNRIAEEGYETAQDVLFPGKKIQDKRLHYGPVIPGL